jgi:AcrR family transcriptional regulator
MRLGESAKLDQRTQAAHSEPSVDGQVYGPKGARTRRRIMEATAALLTVRRFNDIRITDIARAAGIAQPNFYTYFASIDEAILAIGREISADSLGGYLEADWEGEAGVEHARGLAEAAIELWRRHSEVFSIVGVLADQGHAEFAALRVRQMRVVYKGFEAKVRKAQARGDISADITPRLAGYECVSVIAGAGQKYDLYIASGFSREQIVETTARMLHLIATGKRP